MVSDTFEQFEYGKVCCNCNSFTVVIVKTSLNWCPNFIKQASFFLTKIDAQLIEGRLVKVSTSFGNVKNTAQTKFLLL